ncbi:MAG: toll/interleukin-1 receptor domain-containing protein [Sphingopyxis sp.]
MSDVFISYSREDIEKVKQIAAAVQGEGYDLWWDKDLPPHRSYGDVIQEKIGGAKAVIVVWSENSTKSEWVRAEADMARNQQKLVQTSIDDGMPPLPFNQIQFASLSDWGGERDHPAWSRVLVSLVELVGAAQRVAPPAASPVKPSAPIPQTAPKKNQLPLILSLVAGAFVVLLFLAVLLNNANTQPIAAEESSAPVAGATVPATPVQPQASAPAPSAPAPTAGSQCTDGRDRHVVVANDTQTTLFRLYGSNVNRTDWEEDVLGSAVLNAGQSINVNWDDGSCECMFDFKAVFSDGTETVRRAFNVCTESQWRIVE